MAGKTRYVRLKAGGVDQVNNVTGIAISSPTVINGTFRDTPPVVVGGAAAGAAIGTSAEISIQVAGGVSPTSTSGTATGPPVTATASASGDSSVLQDDHFTHTAPRSLSEPIALWVFTTDDGLATYDVVYLFDEVIGITNVAPQGWVIGTSQ